jgi:endonuclease/exonuclease/phosphatase family metal-dependent hydrolase
VAPPVIRRAASAGLMLAAFGCALFVREPPAVRLRVATYNIQAGGGNLLAIAETIRELNADVIGLQEVDVHWSARSRFADQAAELGRALDMEVRFAPIYRLPNPDGTKPVREFGVAILSRHRIVSFRNDTLTRLSTQDTAQGPAPMPGLANAVVEIQGRRIRVFSTHLDYRADPRVRARQVTEMLRYIGDSEEPVLLLGDLNAAPDAPELRPLFGRLRDVWSSRSDSGHTYPAPAPTKRIDYVLASSDFFVGHAAVVPVLAADHRPVAADLAIFPPIRTVP